MTDDLKARLRRQAESIKHSQDASEAAKEEQFKWYRDFLVEFQELVDNLIEPALAEARDELDRGGVSAGVQQLTGGRVALRIFRDSSPVAVLSYSVPTGTYGKIVAEITSEKRSGRTELSLSEVTKEAVFHHAWLLGEAAKGKPIDYLGAWQPEQ